MGAYFFVRDLSRRPKPNTEIGDFYEVLLSVAPTTLFE
jgi:hypothetical protein